MRIFVFFASALTSSPAVAQVDVPNTFEVGNPDHHAKLLELIDNDQAAPTTLFEALDESDELAVWAADGTSIEVRVYTLGSLADGDEDDVEEASDIDGEEGDTDD